jgi:hypothetical protein
MIENGLIRNNQPKGGLNDNHWYCSKYRREVSVFIGAESPNII